MKATDFTLTVYNDLGSIIHVWTDECRKWVGDVDVAGKIGTISFWDVAGFDIKTPSWLLTNLSISHPTWSIQDHVDNNIEVCREFYTGRKWSIKDRPTIINYPDALNRTVLTTQWSATLDELKLRYVVRVTYQQPDGPAV